MKNLEVILDLTCIFGLVSLCLGALVKRDFVELTGPELRHHGTLGWNLPKFCYPTSYDLLLNFTQVEDVNVYKGETRIDVTFLADSEAVWLYALDLDILAIEIKSQSSEISDVTQVHYDQKEDILIVKSLTEQGQYYRFQKDQKYTLQIVFKGSVKSKKNVLSFVESEGARRIFPCFDEPEYLASLQLTVVHAAELLVVSNSPIKHTHTSSFSSKQMVTEFKSIDKMQISAFALALLREYKKIPLPQSDRRLSLAAFVPGDYEQSDLILKSLKDLDLTYESLRQNMKLDYPLEKVDYVFVSSGFMYPAEGLGLIIKQFEPDRQRFLTTKDLPYREVAYQLFGFNAASKSWSDAWLVESASAFLGLQMAEQRNDLRTFDVLNFFYCHNPANQLFRTTMYQKPETKLSDLTYLPTILGSCFFLMMESAVGRDVVNQTLINYYKQGLEDKNFKTLSQDRFFEELEQTFESFNGKPNKGVGMAFQSWTQLLEFPFINITVNYQTNQVEIEILDMYTWKPKKNVWIPIRFATIDETSNEVFIIPPDKKFFIDFTSLRMSVKPDKCLYVNMRDRTMYAIFYDQNNLKCLAQALKRNHTVISPHNRAAIVRNAFEGFWYPNLEVLDIYKDMMKFLNNETDYYVWTALIMSFKAERSTYNLQRFNPFFKDYLQMIYDKFNSREFTIKSSDMFTSSLKEFFETIAIAVGYKLRMPAAMDRIKELIYEDIQQNRTQMTVPLDGDCEFFKYMGLQEYERFKALISDKSNEDFRSVLRKFSTCLREEIPNEIDN